MTVIIVTFTEDVSYELTVEMKINIPTPFIAQ